MGLGLQVGAQREIALQRGNEWNLRTTVCLSALGVGLVLETEENPEGWNFWSVWSKRKTEYARLSTLMDFQGTHTSSAATVEWHCRSSLPCAKYYAWCFTDIISFNPQSTSRADLIIFSIKCFVQGKTTRKWWSWDSNTDTSNIKVSALFIILGCLFKKTLLPRGLQFVETRYQATK